MKRGCRGEVASDEEGSASAALFKKPSTLQGFEWSARANMLVGCIVEFHLNFIVDRLVTGLRINEGAYPASAENRIMSQKLPWLVTCIVRRRLEAYTFQRSSIYTVLTTKYTAILFSSNDTFRQTPTNLGCVALDGKCLDHASFHSR
jgi:hypothetical protein